MSVYTETSGHGTDLVIGSVVTKRQACSSLDVKNARARQPRIVAIELGPHQKACTLPSATLFAAGLPMTHFLVLESASVLALRLRHALFWTALQVSAEIGRLRCKHAFQHVALVLAQLHRRSGRHTYSLSTLGISYVLSLSIYSDPLSLLPMLSTAGSRAPAVKSVR